MNGQSGKPTGHLSIQIEQTESEKVETDRMLTDVLADAKVLAGADQASGVLRGVLRSFTSCRLRCSRAQLGL